MKADSLPLTGPKLWDLCNYKKSKREISFKEKKESMQVSHFHAELTSIPIFFPQKTSPESGFSTPINPN